MCLGEQARQANKAAKRDYEYKLAKRKSDWMQTLSLTKTEHIQYEQGIEASNLGLLAMYGDIEDKRKQAIGEAFQANETAWKEFLQSNEGAKLFASGATGKSIDRIAALELGDMLSKSSRRSYK